MEKFKIINTINEEDEIRAINYGPFDNGYLLLGFSSGQLLGIDLLDMELILNIKLFDEPIQNITYEPTNLVFISSDSKEMVALNLIKK